MTITKLLLTFCLMTRYTSGTPIIRSNPKHAKMTVESHPMLASVFSVANSVKMAELSQKQFGAQKPIHGGGLGNVGVVHKGNQWNKDVFRGAPNDLGAMKEIPGHVGKVEHKKVNVVPQTGVKDLQGGPKVNEPGITIFGGLTNGLCRYCKQTQNITCIQIYCFDDSMPNKIIQVDPSLNVLSKPALENNINMIPNNMNVPRGNVNRDSMTTGPEFQNNVHVLFPPNTASRPFLPIQGGVPQTNMAGSSFPPQGDFPTMENPMRENVVPLPNFNSDISHVDSANRQHIIQDTSSGFPPDSIVFAPLAEMVNGPMDPGVSQINFQAQPNGVVFPPSSAGVNEGAPQHNVPPPSSGPVIPHGALPSEVPLFHPNNDGAVQTGPVFPLEPTHPFGEIGVPDPTFIDTSIPNGGPGSLTPISISQPGAPSVVPGNLPQFASVVPGNSPQFAPVVPDQPFNPVDLPHPDPNVFQQGNTAPSAISFDNELIPVDIPAGSSNINQIPVQPIAAPDGSFSLDNVFQSATGLIPVLPGSGPLNPPATGPANGNEPPPLDLVMNEALRPLTDGQENANIADIGHQHLGDTIPSSVPAARPFDAMSPLTGHGVAVLPQPAGTSNQNINHHNPQIPVNDTLANVAQALDFFALKPHSQMSAIDQVSPVVLNDVSQTQTGVLSPQIPVNDTLASVARALDFFALKPHSQMSVFDQVSPVVSNDVSQRQADVQGQVIEPMLQPNRVGVANDFLLDGAGQPIQTFSALNQKIRSIHVAEQEGLMSNVLVQSPGQPVPNSMNAMQPQMKAQNNLIQTTTIEPVTIITMSPERKAELNKLSKTLLNNVVL